MILVVLSSELKAQDGIFKTYYSNGNIKAELSYVRDVLDGTSYWFYLNGNLQTEKTFSNGKLNGWIKYYYDTGLLKEELFIVEGIKDGAQKFYYANGGLKKIINFDMGRMIDMSEINYDSNYIASVEAFKGGNRQLFNDDKKDEFLCDAEICPEPLGGVNAIQENIAYPNDARLYGLEGFVTLVAEVDANGNVTKTEIVKGLGLGCDEAAEDAVKTTRFIPGQDEGSVITSRVTLRVEFSLKEPELHFAGPLETAINNELNINDSTLVENAETINLIKINFDEQAIPVGGIDAILEKLVIPPTAKRLKINGDILVFVTVDEFGFVIDTEVLKKIGYGCDEAVESAIFKTMFEPAKQNGKSLPSKVKIIIPIRTE